MNQELRDQVKKYLRNHCRGRENAQTSSKIASELNLTEEDTTNPNLRKYIRDILLSEELPIGSCNSGYFVIVKAGELREVVNDLNKRIIGIQERLQSVCNAFLEDKITFSKISEKSLREKDPENMKSEKHL